MELETLKDFYVEHRRAACRALRDGRIRVLPDVRQLGYESQAEMLQATLDEEGNADKTLTDIAEATINIEAEV